MKAGLALLLGLILSGCNSGIGYVATNYDLTQLGDEVHTKDGDFKVWDKPSQGKILVSPSLAAVIAHPRPENMGISVEGGPEAKAAKGAVFEWFHMHEKHCVISNAVEVARPEYEITYSCKPDKEQ